MVLVLAAVAGFAWIGWVILTQQGTLIRSSGVL